MNRPEGSHRQKYNNSKGLHYPIFNNRYIIQTENQQGNTELKLHVRPNGLNRHFIQKKQNTQSSQAHMEHSPE